VFNITGGEIIIVLVLALVVLGPDKLPGFIRSTGRLYSELRRMASGFKQEFDEAMAEPMREMRDTANMAKQWFDVSSDDDDVFAAEDPLDEDEVPDDIELPEGVLDDEDDGDGGDDPNFYDENGNLLDARAVAQLLAAEDDSTSKEAATPEEGGEGWTGPT